MAFWKRSSVLSDAVQDWLARGLIEPGTAQALNQDIAANYKTRSFSSVIVLLGVMCLAFGAMTFVAANWDEMSSLMRVGLLFISMWAAWGLSIWFKMRGSEWLAQCFVLLACGLFGASIMLIGQIYHIQGKPKDAVWLWAGGTIIGALFTRSVPALCLAIILYTVWVFIDAGIFSSKVNVEYSFLIYWLICAVTSWWLASRFAGHLSMASLTIWALFTSAVYFGFNDKDQQALFLLIVLFLAIIGISAALYSGETHKWFKGFEYPSLIYLLFTCGGLLTIWYFATDIRWNGEWRLIKTAYWPGMIGVVATLAIAILGHKQDNPNKYDIWVTAIFAIVMSVLSGFIHRVPFLMEALMLALSIWTIRMGWRLDYRALSTLGFFGFAGVMILIYFETVGTLLGTSAFYLGAGILLLAGAIILPKLMRSKKGETA